METSVGWWGLLPASREELHPTEGEAIAIFKGLKDTKYYTLGRVGG